MTLKEAAELLRSCGIESAAHDARKIFEAVGGASTAELISGDLPADEATERAVIRRSRREPLQYIIGEVGFFREVYEVSPACLIPRQETELAVELAVGLLPEGAEFLDLCTGSGCIAISTLKNTKNTTATAVDLSEDAIEVAKRNAERCGVLDRIRIHRADALADAVEGSFFAVISNPPYVTEAAYQTLEPELGYEPKMALVGGGEDGADFYRRITSLYCDRIPKEGFILFEIGYDQADILRAIASKNGMSCEIKKDYSGFDRLALLRKA